MDLLLIVGERSENESEYVWSSQSKMAAEATKNS